MIEFYPQIKFVHILCVILSGSLFTLRGLLMLMRSRYTNHVALRMLSYAIDTTLLTAALVLRPTRRLVAEGVFAGISSGAALAGAAKVASEIESGVIVFIVCDGGWKYLSTGAYTDDLDEAEAKEEQIIYF